MKTIINTVVFFLLSLACVQAFTFATIESISTPSPIQMEESQTTRDCVIAKFRLVAIGDPFGDSEGFKLEQIAFDLYAPGSWIYHQITNLRLVDESGTVITDSKRVFSNPIVCDCDTGRVIFDNVTNFIVKTNISREFSLVADVGGIFASNGFVRVVHKPSDSRIVDLSNAVNQCLTIVPNQQELNEIRIETPIVIVPLVRIDSFVLIDSPNDWKLVALFGKIKPYTPYSVEVSTNLTSWEVVGFVAPNDSTVLKEVAAIIGKEYFERAFFRLKELPPQ